jgi:hypothetical protein
LEAADGKSEVNGFEVGVFCGRYTTPAPLEYFERSSRLHAKAKKKSAALAYRNGPGGAILVASGGPVNGTASYETLDDSGIMSPEYREDVRYVLPSNFRVGFENLTTLQHS